MATLAELMVDKEKMEKGAWRTFMPFPGVSVKLLIASNNNEAYLKAVTNLIRQNLKAIREDPTNQVERDTIKPAVAQHLLLGWEGLEDEEGKAIPYSYEAALGLFNTPELFHLYDFVRVQADIVSNYRKQLNKDAEKN